MMLKYEVENFAIELARKNGICLLKQDVSRFSKDSIKTLCYIIRDYPEEYNKIDLKYITDWEMGKYIEYHL